MTRLSRVGVFAMPKRTYVPASICGLMAMAALAACTENSPASSPAATSSTNPRAMTVQATDSECKLSATSAPSGSLTFSVTNGGTKVTEFYVYGEDGKRVVGEVEDISPGITRELVLNAQPGNYITACKPGMAGDGIRAPFVVSDSGEPVPSPSG
jgi:iron uptake system component EfeO